MSCGKDFVETLKKIGYPGVDELNGEDFDWMFESSEDRSFLEWFCGNVNEQHVVSEKELQDFNNLLESGKPILEGNALDEVLKTCKPVDSQSQEEEKEELKKLQDELQTLQKMKNLQIHRHNKLQLMISENSSTLQALKRKEDEALKDLKDGLAVFTAGNNKLDNDLLSLMDGVKKLASFFTASDSEQGARSHPVFFSQLSLDKYLSQEEQCTAALISYAKKHFSPGMPELFESVHEDSVQLRDESKPVTCDEANGAYEESHEMTRLQMAYICAQHQLIQMEAKEESVNSAIRCAESMLKTLKNEGVGKQENLEAKISSFKGRIATIRQHIAQLNNEELPSLLKEHAQLLTVPVVKADLDREIARQDCFISKQDEICSHLLRQKASFELIQLAYEIELKKQKDVHHQLDNLLESLKQSSNELQQRLEVLSELSQPAQPRNTIGPKDEFSRRLYQLLEGEDKKQLFKTYKNLQRMAQKLVQDCAAAQHQLAVSSQEQSLMLSKLDSDVNALHDALFCGGNQLLFCSRELTEQFNQLEDDLNKLNQLIMDLIADLKSKRNFLESNKLHQMERNLYVYFFKDEDHLKELVEKLEWQSEAKASGLGNQNFTTGIIVNMEHYTSYIGCEISEVPLSDAAQRIMSALQSVPTGIQTSRKNNQSIEKTEENKIGDKDAHLKNEKEINDSTIALLKSSASPARSTGQKVRTVHANEMLSYQATKILSYYQELDLSKWGYGKKNLSVKAKKLKDDEKNVATPLKRKQDVPTCHLEKKRLPLMNYTSHERRYNWTSRRPEFSENYPCDIRSLGNEEKRELLANIEQAVAFVTTMIFQDGSSQLNSEQALTSSVKGIVILVKNQTDHLCSPSYSSSDGIRNAADESDKLIYLKTECSPLWEQEEQAHKKFAWQVLFQMLHRKAPVICFNAKDFLRTVLQIYGNEISWKQVADSVVLDPRIAAWLINPSDTVPSFECLTQKYFEKSFSMETENTDTGTLRNVLYKNLGVNLEKLYTVMADLTHDLQVQGLWKLFCTLELPLIKILAVMETHKIHVNKQELKKTSEILGLRLKELEQEAHQIAGERFLLTSSSQLREVLFEKLKLHTLCEKIPRTERQQVASTSEVVLSKLQDLHPLPKIMLEYRQVRKIKSTYVDGLRTCMRKGFISSTWNQTGTVTGRLSSKHPEFNRAHGRSSFSLSSSVRQLLTDQVSSNVQKCIYLNNIQGISKHPVRIVKKQYIKGKEEEIVTISPRALFVSKKGYTFLAADFSHIELRILADLSSEPELLKLFQEPETTDIFTTLASQWKGIPSEEVKQADREQAKRVVYSVVYGAGKERLAECLGITPLEASHFIESFMQKYKKVNEFTKKTIEECRTKGYVVSIMGRKRPLVNINAQDYKLRTQAERQAVNFVVQGSAADLCKMAMVEIFTSVVTSPTLTARLIAQIHDELLFEVEDSQIQEFSALVKRTMESLQQTTALEVPLKVPLKVILTTGKSWGCMTELQEM